MRTKNKKILNWKTCTETERFYS